MNNHPNYLWLWSDESSFSLNGSVANNTFVRYGVDREGRPKGINDRLALICILGKITIITLILNNINFRNDSIIYSLKTK